MCTSRCGVIATVEDGVLTQVNADPDHPNGCICVKGAAAPEIVYSPDRLHYPMAAHPPQGRSRSRLGARSPGTKRSISPRCDSMTSKITTAPKPWCFRAQRPPAAPPSTSTAGCSAWPMLSAVRICSRRITSALGTAASARNTPMAAACRCPTSTILNACCIWGINPPATSPAQALRINSRAQPRRQADRHRSAQDHAGGKSRLLAAGSSWKRRRTGDGDDPCSVGRKSVRRRFHAPLDQRTFLVRCDNHQLLTER